jgi:hypothetical protein
MIKEKDKKYKMKKAKAARKIKIFLMEQIIRNIIQINGSLPTHKIIKLQLFLLESNYLHKVAHNILYYFIHNGETKVKIGKKKMHKIVKIYHKICIGGEIKISRNIIQEELVFYVDRSWSIIKAFSCKEGSINHAIDKNNIYIIHIKNLS